MRDAAAFVRAAPGLGLRGRTAAKIARQLVSERVNRDRLVRRRTSQTQIGFDFFLKELKRTRPDISFFFTNHVASSMHRYWPALYPGDYADLKYAQDWQDQWAGEIPFAVREAVDQLTQLKRFVDANSGYCLLVASSMGQAAVENKDPVRNEVVISDLKKFLGWAGLGPEDWENRPAMNPQFNVFIAGEKLDPTIERLRKLRVCGRSVSAENLGEQVVRLEVREVNVSEFVVTDDGTPVDPAALGLSLIDLQDAAGANAYHIPEGSLIVYDPARARHRDTFEVTDTLSTVEIAPSILQNFGVERRSYMEAGRLI